MGTIRETFIIVDQATSSLRSINTAASAATSSIEGMGKAAPSAAEKTTTSTNQLEKSMKQASNTAILLDQNITRAIGKSASATVASVNSLKESMEQTNSILSQIVQKQKKHTEESEKTQSKWAKILNTVKNAAVVTGGIALVKNIASAADEQSQLNARINMMNDNLQTTAELQKMIYTASQNSRGSYTNTANMVGKFGTLAPDAFGSSAEVVNFAEQINKHLTLSSTSSTGADAVILQLTQAMGAGVLRGEELNSVLEQAPTIAQAIAKYLGMSVAEMRELASDGALTADVVKNALFATAEETNAKFAEMPMTFAQLWQSGLNAVQQAAMPVLQATAKGATAIHDNWSTIAPVLVGVATAAGVVAIALAAQAAATWIAKAANDGLVASLLSNPLTWIAVAIGFVVSMIYRWIQSVGGISAAWLIAKNYILTAWSAIQIGFMTGVFAVQNWLDTMNLKFQTIGASIANAVGDMKVNVLTIIENMVNGAIGLLNGFISSVNMIPGVAIDLVDKVSFAAGAAASNEAAKAARASELSGLQSQIEANAAAREAQLSQMRAEAEASQANRLAEIAAAQQESSYASSSGISTGDIPAWDGEIGDVGKVGTVGSVKKIDGDVRLSDEDIKLYRDLAERRYMNNVKLETLAPQINITVPKGSGDNISEDDLAMKLKAVLVKQQAAHATAAHGY